MEDYFRTLVTVYEIVKGEKSPETYLCTAHEIILRQTQDEWSAIQKHLEKLAAEKYLVIRQLDRFTVSVTAAGVNKAKSLKNNFYNNNFTFRIEEKPNISSIS